MKLQTTQKDSKLYGKLPDTGWVDIALLNGVTARDSSLKYKPQIRKIGNIVFLKGQLYIPANVNLAGTIPEIFLPSYEVRFPLLKANSWLDTAGNIRLNGNTSILENQPLNTSWVLE